MFISYDYRCINCKTKEARFIKKEDRDDQYCKKCKFPMLRLPPGPATTFKYNDK